MRRFPLIVPVLLAVLALLSPEVRAQSADQEVVSVVDTPDPVLPGHNLTYTVTVRNNGPDAAFNGGINVNLDLNLSYVSASAPAGFTCFVSGNNISCINPSFGIGTATISIVAKVADGLISYPDGTLTSNFYPSGTTTDPNTANNQKVATTTWDSPQFDASMAVSHTPDPVRSGQNVTYTAVVSQSGPDTAGQTSFQVYNNNTLLFQSASAPAGFTCTLPNVGSAAVFSCSAPSLAPGTYFFTVVLRADVNVLGPFDSSVTTVFNVNATGNDTNPGNNSKNETVQYVTPKSDMTITSVLDSPDPVLVDGALDYLVTVTNLGPDPAVEARFNVYNNGGLSFVSIVGPSGFPCSPPPVGQLPVIQCGTSSFPVNQPADFVITVRVPRGSYGPNGGSTQTTFVASSNNTDPANGNNTWTEVTTVIANDLFKNGFE